MVGRRLAMHEAIGGASGVVGIYEGAISEVGISL